MACCCLLCAVGTLLEGGLFGQLRKCQPPHLLDLTTTEGMMQMCKEHAQECLHVQGCDLQSTQLRWRTIDQSITHSLTHFQHCAGCVQGVPEFCLSMNLCPELGVPNCATTSEPLNPPLRNQSSTWAACPYWLC